MNPVRYGLLILACLYYANIQAGTVVGYYAAWMRSELPAEEIPFNYLTHIVHAFAWPEPDGSLSTYDGFYYPQLIEQAHNAGKKILVSLGGAEQSYGFSSMASESSARSAFIDHILEFCTVYGYDGVDVDWEFPENSTDKNNLSLLVYNLRQKFINKNPELMITMAVPAGDWYGRWFDFSILKSYVDWFSCMTYDFHGVWTDHAGHNSPLFHPPNDPCGSLSSSIQYLNSARNIPKEQILAGLPFYGIEFKASELYGPSTGSDKYYYYSEIVPKIGNGWEYYWDNFSKVPYLINSTHTRLISYDDTLSIRPKCDYVKDNDLQGVMIWALGHDAISGKQVLLETVGRSLESGIRMEKELSVQPDLFLIDQNFPNPFNPVTIIKYQISKPSRVTLEIYNLQGQSTAILVDEQEAPGYYAVSWDGVDQEGSEVAGGIYFYRMKVRSGSEAMVETRKMIKLK